MDLNLIGFRVLLKMVFLFRLIFIFALVGSVNAQSFTASYQPASRIRSAELRQIQLDWQRNQLLEGLADQLSRQFTLSEPLTVGLGECGGSNAFYRPDTKVIVICLELIPDIINRIVRAEGRGIDRDRLIRTATGALVFIVFHEIGHAFIDIENLPVLGRNEDAADMISTYLILQEPALADWGIAGGLFFFSQPNSLIPGFFSQRHLADEHSLDPQRAVNLACAAYGKDPRRYVWAMHAARVTERRAVRCAGEYEQLDRSVRELLRGITR